MMRCRTGFAALAGVVGLAAGIAEAGPVYGFYRISNNGGAVGVDSQLTVEVSDAGSNQVDFIFRNSGSLASSICDVYFDDGTLLGIAQIFNGGAGVDFSQGASPGNLPGGNSVGFVATAGFTADSNPPAQPNGVNPGEMLTVRFNLLSGVSFADTLAALEQGFLNDGGVGTLRIGIHVQGYANGASEAFINDGGTPFVMVPLPGAAAMGAVGLVLVSRRRRAL